MLLVVLLASAVLLLLALRGLDWARFFDTLAGANYYYVGGMLVWSSCAYYLRAIRWRILLSAGGHLSPLGVFWANMAGYLGNQILPARAGEVVRAAHIARREHVPMAFALAAGVTERVTDLFTLVVIGALSLFVMGDIPPSMKDALGYFGVVVFGALAFILATLSLGTRTVRFVNLFAFLPQSFRDRAGDFLRHFIDGIGSVSHPKRAAPFIALTGLIWLLDGAGMVILAASLGETLTLRQSFVFIAALGVSSALPSTPGYVGVYQFVAVATLVPFSFSQESALALILFVQILNFIVVAFWGVLGLWVGLRESANRR